MKRIYSIDFVRGIAMIIMALDHVRDLLHVSSLGQSPTDLSTTTPALFFTRWVTYLCAPIFVFLAGTSVYLSQKNKNNRWDGRIFLLKRGLFLIALEFTVVNLGLYFDPGFHLMIFEVIAAIGFGFAILSLLLNLSPKLIGIAGILILLLHDAIIYIPMQEGAIWMRVLTPFFSPAAFPLFSGHVFVVAYPPIPWLGILLTGYSAGMLFETRENERRRIFLLLGLFATAVFIILRWCNIYGDPVPWTAAKTTAYTFLSFMNVSKYPPSLSFSLITLGVMFIFLWIAESSFARRTDIVNTYGKAPLFYFVVHFYLIHLLLIGVLLLQGFHLANLEFVAGTFGRPRGQPNGLPLWAIYVIWMIIVAVLYLPCKWFVRNKSSHSYWLKYV